MPRTKSDQVITHRIEFSPKEREMLEALVGGRMVNSLASTVKLGAEAAGLGIAAWIAYWTAKETSSFFNAHSDGVVGRLWKGEGDFADVIFPWTTFFRDKKEE